MIGQIVMGFVTLVTIAAVAIPAIDTPTVGTVVSAVGYPVVLTILWHIWRSVKAINESMVMYRIEHEMVMEWWQQETGQQRPSTALAKAKKAGM